VNQETAMRREFPLVEYFLRFQLATVASSSLSSTTTTMSRSVCYLIAIVPTFVLAKPLYRDKSHRLAAKKRADNELMPTEEVVKQKTDLLAGWGGGGGGKRPPTSSILGRLCLLLYIPSTHASPEQRLQAATARSNHVSSNRQMPKGVSLTVCYLNAIVPIFVSAKPL
jgi:hypothetical protein